MPSTPSQTDRMMVIGRVTVQDGKPVVQPVSRNAARIERLVRAARRYRVAQTDDSVTELLAAAREVD